jgi:hypothetical protein
MSVASCRIIFLWSDVVFNRVFSLVSFWISFRNWIPNWGCACRGFLPRDATQPDPTRPALARVPWRPCTFPMCVPPSPCLSFPHSILPRTTPSLSPISLPRGALGFGDGDRRIWTPRWAPLPSLSLSSPPPSLPSSPHGLPTCAPGGSPRALLRASLAPPLRAPRDPPTRRPAPQQCSHARPRAAPVMPLPCSAPTWRRPPGPRRGCVPRRDSRGLVCPQRVLARPGTRNVTPRAQPHALGDWFWF